MAQCRRCGERLTGASCAACGYPAAGDRTSSPRHAHQSSAARRAAARDAASAVSARTASAMSRKAARSRGGASQANVPPGMRGQEPLVARPPADVAVAATPATEWSPEFPPAELPPEEPPHAAQPLLQLETPEQPQATVVLNASSTPAKPPSRTASRVTAGRRRAARASGWSVRTYLMLFLLAVLVLAVVISYAASLRADSPSGGGSAAPTKASASASASTSASGKSQASPKAQTQAQAQAKAALTKEYAADKARFKADGHWVVQLASKWNGLKGDGSKTYGWVDIEKQYAGLKKQFGKNVILVQSTDFGKQRVRKNKPADEPIWVTLYDPGNLASGGDATKWCKKNFPDRTGDELRDVCLPRKALAPTK